MQATEKKKAVGFVMPDQPHYVDHLGVICIIMGIPLLFVQEEERDIAKKYYPGLQTELVDYFAFTPEYLIENYDVIFNTDLWDRDLFHGMYGHLEEKKGSRFRIVHCPHGFSDKGFYLSKCAKEDITLIYGQNMLDQMKDCGVLEELNQHVICGNYRYAFYQQNKDFYDKIVQDEILSQFAKKQPTIIYAPTWQDFEDTTTFFSSAEAFFDTLPDHYNMIVKLHPRLEDQDGTVADYYRIVGQYEEKPNMVFLRQFPLVYPLLACSDVYIGDMSSVGYDFLAFNRPMFFLNKHKRDPKTDRSLYLFRCGIEVLPEDVGNIYSIIEENLEGDQERFGKVREEVYAYTFAPGVTFDALKTGITKAFNSL